MEWEKVDTAADNMDKQVVALKAVIVRIKR